MVSLSSQEWRHSQSGTTIKNGIILFKNGIILKNGVILEQNDVILKNDT